MRLCWQLSVPFNWMDGPWDHVTPWLDVQPTSLDGSICFKRPRNPSCNTQSRLHLHLIPLTTLHVTYHNHPTLTGTKTLQATVRVKDGKKFQHEGIRIELVGSIGAYCVVFLLVVTDLCEIEDGGGGMARQPGNGRPGEELPRDF
jgi:hypothetical protein